MNSKTDIRNLSLPELISYFKSSGEKIYRARQIFQWIYKKGIQDFDAMTNLPSDLKGKLKDDFFFQGIRVVKKDISDDGICKFLFDLSDEERVEAVLIPAYGRNTICVSTQAGCKFGCRFCASGIGGWSRNLSCSEIISQILYAKNDSKDKPLTHIVFMGVGEPMDTVALRC